MSQSHKRLLSVRRSAAATVAAAICIASAVGIGESAQAVSGTFSGTCTFDHIDGNGDNVWRLAAANVPRGTTRVGFIWPAFDVFYGYGKHSGKYVTFYTDYSADRLNGRALVARAENRKGAVTAETASFICS